MTKIERIEHYLHEFFNYRLSSLISIRAVSKQKEFGIYRLPKGAEIFDF